MNKQVRYFVPLLHCEVVTAESFLHHLNSIGINAKESSKHLPL